MNLKLQNLDHVKILAKEKAQNTREDQAIYKSYEGRCKIFRFKPARKHLGVTVELVRYTKKVVSRKVLRNNGNGKSPDSNGGSKKRNKRGTAE
jgi:hypothetical protein